MKFELTAEQQEFTGHFRDFCEAEIGPNSWGFEKEGRVPSHIFKKLASIGYTGLMFPEEFGGQGASIFEATLAQELLSEYCGSTFFSVGASIGLFGNTLIKSGTSYLRQKYLPSIISGEKVGALAVTEPGAGSDVNGLTALAKETSDGYVLSGQKTFITNAPICDYAIVLARVIDMNSKEKGLTHFIVEKEYEGFSAGKPMDKMGLKASPTGELFFDKCLVPKENILGAIGKGFRQTMEAFNFERLALGAYSVGVMAACLKDAKSYAKTRKAFGVPIAKHQSVGFMLADIVVKYEASRLLLYQTAYKMDQVLAAGQKISSLNQDTAIVKYLASTHAREVTNLAVQIHGGAGYIEETRVCRLYRDIKLAEIGGGTSEIQQIIISRAEEKKIKK